MRFVAAKHGGDVKLGRGSPGARRRVWLLVATCLALLIAGAVWSSSSRSADGGRGGGGRQATTPQQRVASVRAAAAADVDAEPVVYGFKVVATYPHDRTCFTQGLQYGGGDTLYESCGQYGQSDVRHVRLKDGRVLARTPVDGKYFAEGLASVGDTLLQLTWQTNTVLRYNATSLALLGTAATQLSDGWGLASSVPPGDDVARLWATDGSSTLSSLDPVTLRTVASVTVTDGARPVRLLNELEVVGGAVWANIWLTDCIAMVDGLTGRVTGYLLMHGLRGSGQTQGEDVLNGIAWDGGRDRLFVTGKYWAHLYEVTIHPLLTGRPAEHLARARTACVR